MGVGVQAFGFGHVYNGPGQAAEVADKAAVDKWERGGRSAMLDWFSGNWFGPSLFEQRVIRHGNPYVLLYDLTKRSALALDAE